MHREEFDRRSTTLPHEGEEEQFDGIEKALAAAGFPSEERDEEADVKDSSSGRYPLGIRRIIQARGPLAWGVLPPLTNRPLYPWQHTPPPRSHTARPDGRRTSSTTTLLNRDLHQGVPSLQYEMPPMAPPRIRRRSGLQSRNDNGPGHSSRDPPPFSA